MLIKSHSHTVRIASKHASAGVVASIAVDSSLESFPVDIVNHRLQSVREFGGMDFQLPRVFVATVEISVVDIDMVESHSLETLRHHGVRLGLDEIIIDVQSIRVP